MPSHGKIPPLGLFLSKNFLKIFLGLEKFFLSPTNPFKTGKSKNNLKKVLRIFSL